MTVIVTPNEIIDHDHLETTYGAVDTVRCQINGAPDNLRMLSVAAKIEGYNGQ